MYVRFKQFPKVFSYTVSITELCPIHPVWITVDHNSDATCTFLYCILAWIKNTSKCYSLLYWIIDTFKVSPGAIKSVRQEICKPRKYYN